MYLGAGGTLEWICLNVVMRGERLNVGVGAWVVVIRAVYAWGQGRFVWPQSGLEPVWIERHGAGHSHGNAGLESGAGLTATASGYPTGIPLPETGLMPPQLLPQRLLPVGEIQLFFLQSVLKQEGSGSYGEFSLKTRLWHHFLYIITCWRAHPVETAASKQLLPRPFTARKEAQEHISLLPPLYFQYKVSSQGGEEEPSWS